MPPGNWNLEWLNHNSQRRYPLAGDADAVDATGSFRLPDDFLVGLYLPIHAGLNVSSAGFFLKSVSVAPGGYGIIVGYQPAVGDAVNVATALIPAQGFVRNSVFPLGGVGDFSDTAGKVVIGRLENINDQPPGFWSFGLENTRIDPDGVRPFLRGLSSLTCVNGDQRSVPLYGDVELVAGANMQLVPIVQVGQNPVIRVNAISGEGTVQACVCEGDVALPDPIRTIQGVAPTTAGAFNLVGSSCVEVQTIPNGIRLVDKCAQPCCGAPELERITADMERLGREKAAVENFVTRLDAQQSAMDLVVLGSKLNDRGCSS